MYSGIPCIYKQKKRSCLTVEEDQTLHLVFDYFFLGKVEFTLTKKVFSNHFGVPGIVHLFVIKLSFKYTKYLLFISGDFNDTLLVIHYHYFPIIVY